jgi:hypothetical protein
MKINLLSPFPVEDENKNNFLQSVYHIILGSDLQEENVVERQDETISDRLENTLIYKAFIK